MLIRIKCHTRLCAGKDSVCRRAGGGGDKGEWSRAYESGSDVQSSVFAAPLKQNEHYLQLLAFEINKFFEVHSH